jgi:hypothetical protein
MGRDSSKGVCFGIATVDKFLAMGAAKTGRGGGRARIRKRLVDMRGIALTALACPGEVETAKVRLGHEAAVLAPVTSGT